MEDKKSFVNINIFRGRVTGVAENSNNLLKLMRSMEDMIWKT